MKRFLFIIAGLILALPVWAQENTNVHEQYVQEYHGTKTCLKCHKKEAYEVFYSDHYQWKGPNPDLVPQPYHKIGKINSVNDYCMDANANWMYPVKLHGHIIFPGCSICHAGLGLKPSDKPTEEQLENIDCLVCHAKNYKRMPKKINGVWRYVPAMPKDKVLEAAQHPILPGRAQCLRCHLKAGGGFNNKHGDIETALLKADRNYDVHMGKGGAGLDCLSCHKGKHHRIVGRGSDLGVTEFPGESVRCENCHTEKPHHTGSAQKDAVLNKHAKRVACETCHIPTFARVDGTDMFRDWRKNHFIKKHGVYHPVIKRGFNVIPEYRWWDGVHSYFWDASEPITLNKKGEFFTYKPVGSKDDPKSKIYPFKHHKAWVAYDGKTKMILPISIKYMFTHTDNIGGIKEISKKIYGHEPYSIKWALANRWQNMAHGVVPKEKALQCKDCHSPKGRMPWKALGYPGDPAPGAHL